MASISLPRVLQPRKSSLELERENFEKFQQVSITKAVNSIECPVKEKHVRSAIIGTFQDKSAQTFWDCVKRLPLEGNRIVAWKFCHVLHKVLREGHESVVPLSQKHKERIRNLGKLWGHLKESYGKLIQQYSQLLIVKLDFHRRNPRFPGNLEVSREELDAIGDNNVNTYFEMAVEMFDYMDEILALQSAIFGSLDMSRSNSMTSCGQCRLAPLIPCIQDSSQLYDYCVKILFKLHLELPPDTLQGHRDRFMKQFKDLKQFYLNANTLQYFRNLIHIPPLPEKPPNFLIQSEFLGYVTPVVRLPVELEQSEADASDFVDVSDAGSPSESLSGDLVDLSFPQPAPAAPPDEWVQRMEFLHQENTKLRQDHHVIAERLNMRIGDLETALATKDSELLQERQLRDNLMQQTSLSDKSEEAERRAKAFEDKFNKLKEVYSKLREEHIQLLRQKADVDKQLVGIQKASEEAEKRKEEVEAQLSDMFADHDKVLELTKEIERLRKELQETHLRNEEQQHTLTQEIEKSKQELQEMHLRTQQQQHTLTQETEKSKQELQEMQLRTQEQQQSLNRELGQLKQKLQEMHLKVDQQQLSLKNIFVAFVKEAESIVERSIHEVDNPAISAITCTPDYLSSLAGPLRESVAQLPDLCPGSSEAARSDWFSFEKLICHVIRTSHLSAAYVLHAKATSNTSPDIELGENMAEKCKALGGCVLAVLNSVRDESQSHNVKKLVNSVLNSMDELGSLVERLTGHLKGDSVEIIGDMVETELSNMDKAIEEAANRIAEILSKSRARDSGIKLEVNEKILDTCTSLMLAIRILVQKARLLQAEIVSKGKGTATAKEFYKRNHQWTEGLISAAKAVAMGAKFLLTAADKVVSGEGKLESLIVASQEVAASTAQLVVASRVKASRDSANLTALSQASRGVTQATGQVVATAKDCSQLIEENEELDVSGLSLLQAKRLEMDCQVKVLELEASLQHERQRLAALRRQHYQLAGDVEGWEIMDKP